MYVTYLTTYLGDKLPRFYIGSTTAQRFATGYHGSVRSQKWGALWKEELEKNPHLFTSVKIFDHATRNEALIEEENLQRFFDAVRSPDFVNMAYARGGFINPGTEGYTQEVRARMRAAKLGKKQSSEHVAKRVAKQIGTKRTPEQIENIRRGALNRKHQPSPSLETREKLRKAITEAWKKRKA